MNGLGGRDEEAGFGVEDGGERRSGGGVYGGNGVLVDGIRGPNGNVTVTDGVIGLVNGAATRRSLSRDTEPSTEDVDASKPLPWVGPEERWDSQQPIGTMDLPTEVADGDGSAGTVDVFNGLGDGGEDTGESFTELLEKDVDDGFWEWYAEAYQEQFQEGDRE
jgi:hypothetical protein